MSPPLSCFNDAISMTRHRINDVAYNYNNYCVGNRINKVILTNYCAGDTRDTRDTRFNKFSLFHNIACSLILSL